MADYGELIFTFAEDGLRIEGKKDFTLEVRMCPGREHVGEVVDQQANVLVLSYQDVEYAVKLLCGEFVNTSILKSQNRVLELCFV